MVPIEGLASGPGGFWVATHEGPYVQDPTGRFTRAEGSPKGEATALFGGLTSNTMWVAIWDGKAHVLAHEDRNWRAFDLPPGLEKERIDALAAFGPAPLAVCGCWIPGQPGSARPRCLSP